MADSAVSISSLNPAAAEALRSAYQRAAASTSSSASSRYSSAVVTSSRCVDSSSRFCPSDRLGSPCVNSIKPGPDLGGPRGLGVGVNLGLETLNQLASERGSLFSRKLKCLGK